MSDALTALEQVSAAVNELATVVQSVRSKLVDPAKVQAKARLIALTYYESVHSELEIVTDRLPLIAEIEFVINTILQLTSAPRKKSAYLRQVTELRPYLQEAMIDVMKARGKPRLVVSGTEQGILAILAQILPTTAISYEQVLRDIAGGKRVSWRGPATELREVLREVMDYLAPDDKVMAEPGFQREKELTRPTQKQKVRFILKARHTNSSGVATAEASLATVDESVASLARSTYTRGAVSTHTPTNAAEVRKLKGYVDALLVELLEVSG